jgi:methionine sulfoxide reductase catalytic subunit
MWWFQLFILMHVTLVFITGARVNLNMIFAGVKDGSWSGLAIFVPTMALLAVTWWPGVTTTCTSYPTCAMS